MRQTLDLSAGWGAVLSLGLGLVLGAQLAHAATPVPLENAYWRFEEGSSGAAVPDSGSPVLDSINDNHMRTFNAGTAPVYSAIVPASTVPATGQPNALSMSFTPNRDIYTDGQDINYPIVSEFTLEASFRMNTVGGAYQAIIAKDGKPLAESSLPPLALKVRGDNSLLHIEVLDAGGAARGITSLAPVVSDQWYHAAVVSDGSLMSLYLDSNNGAGYVLQGTTSVNGALYEHNSPWAIGRGMFNGSPADWMDGYVDEVRLSNTALEPSQFLFAVIPEPASLGLLGLAALLLGRRRRSA